MDIASIDAKIKSLKAKIDLLELEKQIQIERLHLNKEGYFIGSDLARELKVTRQYISNNKHLFEVKMHGNKEYFKKKN